VLLLFVDTSQHSLTSTAGTGGSPPSKGKGTVRGLLVLVVGTSHDSLAIMDCSPNRTGTGDLPSPESLWSSVGEGRSCKSGVVVVVDSERSEQEEEKIDTIFTGLSSNVGCGESAMLLLQRLLLLLLLMSSLALLSLLLLLVLLLLLMLLSLLEEAEEEEEEEEANVLTVVMLSSLLLLLLLLLLLWNKFKLLLFRITLNKNKLCLSQEFTVL